MPALSPPIERRVDAPIDALDVTRIRTLLQDAPTGRPDWNVRVVASTGSTNSDLLREVQAAAQEPVAARRLPSLPALLAAEHQTAGRGRLGRTWYSRPGGSLTVSFALTVGRKLADLDGLSLACGLAVGDVLTPLGVDVGLKWPNDVLVDGRKLAGILIEACSWPGTAVVVIGVGINVLARGGEAAGPPTRDWPTVALQSAGSRSLDRNLLAARLARALEARVSRFAAEGFAPFVEEWNALDAWRDRRVMLASLPGDATTGLARGVDDRGALLLEVDGRIRRFIAGDLSLRLEHVR